MLNSRLCFKDYKLFISVTNDNNALSKKFSCKVANMEFADCSIRVSQSFTQKCIAYAGGKGHVGG